MMKINLKIEKTFETNKKKAKGKKEKLPILVIVMRKWNVA